MEVPLILVVVIIASCLGTMTGFGTSTIMVPVLLSLKYPVTETLLFVGIIHWFGNIWKLILFKRGFHWRLVLSFGIPGIAATYLGASLAFDISGVLLSKILGTFLIGYVVYLFVKGSFRIKPSLIAGICGGALSGFLAGLFGIGGAVRGLFLTAFDLPKEVYITTAGAIALIIDTTRLATYVQKGAQLKQFLLWGLIVFIPASFLGARMAKSFVDEIPQEHFRRVIAAFLFLIGMKLILFPA
jgi:uncharacterized membrane protein YfcA